MFYQLHYPCNFVTVDFYTALEKIGFFHTRQLLCLSIKWYSAWLGGLAEGKYLTNCSRGYRELGFMGCSFL